jgi:DNA-binding SARP family transcriptional activator
LSLIGGFSLSCRGEDLRLPGRVQRLVAFLALQERPVPRRRVAFALWPDATEVHAHGSLRASLFRLRSGCPEGVLRDGDELDLGSDVNVDVHRALVLAAHAGAADGDGEELEALLHGGELLPDWYDDWVLIERERFHELRGHALESLSEAHLRAGAVARARKAALAAVHADPLRESSRRALIRAHLADGNHADAVSHYREFADLLGQSGLAPSPQLRELVSSLTAEVTPR